jgi:hypothetical protein
MRYAHTNLDNEGAGGEELDGVGDDLMAVVIF